MIKQVSISIFDAYNESIETDEACRITEAYVDDKKSNDVDLLVKESLQEEGNVSHKNLNAYNYGFRRIVLPFILMVNNIHCYHFFSQE